MSVVVAGEGPADHLDVCLDGVLRGSLREVEVLLAAPAADSPAAMALQRSAHRGDPRLRLVLSDARPALEAAVSRAAGAYLLLTHVDDVVPPGAAEQLVAVARRDRADVVLGVPLDVVGGSRRPAAWATGRAGPDASRREPQRLADHPALAVAVGPGGTLFRAAAWRDVAPALPGWLDAPVAVARVLAAADGIATLDEVTLERHDRQLGRRVEAQDRFRPEVLARRLEVLTRVGEVYRAGPAPVLRAWRVGLLEHLLPPVYVDALGDDLAGVDVLRAGVAGLVDAVPEEDLAAVSLEHRLSAWAAAHGAGDDLALTEDHLADHPHGLPVEAVEGGLLAVEPGDLAAPPPARWRRVEAVDRRLRTRADLRRDRDGLLLSAAAFVEHEPGRPELEVTVAAADGSGAVPVPVEPVVDPGLDEWAARAHEDRADCGLVARLDPARLPGGPDGPWRVTLTVGGRERQHVLRPPGPVRAADVRLRAVSLHGDRLRVSADRPVRLRAVGAKGATAWSADGLTLRTDLVGEQVLLPTGRYDLEATDPDGRPLSAAVVPGDELVGERLLVRLRDTGSGARLVVGAPLTAADRSPRGQQRLRESVYAGPPARPRPGSWLFETFRGRSVGDSPGAVARELLSRDLDLDVGFVVDDPHVVVPDGARAVVRRSREWYDAMGHAAVHVTNAGAPYWWRKRPGQRHLQTWHGTPLKRIGEDRGPGDFATWRHRRRIADQAAGWDAMVSPSPFCSEVYRSAFGYEGEILGVGLPRNDVLASQDAPRLREQVRARLGVGPGQRVVLYAPTWRQYVGVLDAKPLYLDAEALLREVPDAVVLLRGHYNSTRQDDVFRGHPRIRDVTRHPDIAELFLAADMLVTDYSSVMFDFALTDRPVVLLVPDLEQYRDVERGFYFDIETTAPGPLVATTGQVVDVLRGPDAHVAARRAFRDRFCPWDDGRASARVVDHLLAPG